MKKDGGKKGWCSFRRKRFYHEPMIVHTSQEILFFLANRRAQVHLGQRVITITALLRERPYLVGLGRILLEREVVPCDIRPRAKNGAISKGSS